MLKNKLSWIITVMLCSAGALAQTGTSSPYSIAGIGELKSAGFAQFVAVGGASVSQRSRNNFSVMNPASYANLAFTVYDVGAVLSLGKLQTETLETQKSSGNFSHFAMAFPFETKRKMGVSFGLHQVSDVGYEIKNYNNDAIPSYYNLYKGTGGLNKVYAGYGVEVLSGFNVGVNFNYNFGSIQNLQARIYPNSDKYFSFSDETYFSYGGLDYNIGVQYSVQDEMARKNGASRTFNHSLGASFQQKTNLNGVGYRFSETFLGTRYDQGYITSADTVFYANDLKDTIQKPIGFTLGYTVKNGNKWALSLEVEKNLWAGIKEQSNGNKYFDNMRYSAGLSIVPKPNYDEKGDFFKKVQYRVGVRYEDLYYNIGNEPIDEFGISFGLGLPVVKSVRMEEEKVPIVNMVNVTAEYARKGSTSNGLIQENFFNIVIGLNLNDKWFTKRKYR